MTLNITEHYVQALLEKLRERTERIDELEGKIETLQKVIKYLRERYEPIEGVLETDVKRG